MDKDEELSFLDGKEEEVVAEVQEAEVAEPQEQPQESQPVEQPVEEPKEPKQPEPGFVPFAAVLDERDKRKALEQQLQQLQASQPKQEVHAPDMFEDPEGWQAAQASRFEQALYQQGLTMSERFARSQHGDDIVNKAMEWGQQKCASDPLFNQQVIQSGDPVGYAVREFQRDQITSQVTPETLQQFLAWQQAQRELSQQGQPAQQQQTSTPPPKSISGLPSAGGVQHIATHEGAAFDELFKE